LTDHFDGLSGLLVHRIKWSPRSLAIGEKMHSFGGAADMTSRGFQIILILVAVILAGCSGEVKFNQEKAKATLQRYLSSATPPTQGAGRPEWRGRTRGTLASVVSPVPALGATTVVMPFAAQWTLLTDGHTIGSVGGAEATFTISQDREWYLTSVRYPDGSSDQPNLKVR
jgi:hypothetical protein